MAAEIKTVRDALAVVENHARRGTIKNLRITIGAELTQPQFAGCSLEQRGKDTLIVYRSHKEGGFLGIGARTIRDRVLRVVMEGSEIQILPEPGKDDFVISLAKALEHD